MFNSKLLYTLMLLGSSTLFAESIFSQKDFAKENTQTSGFHGTLGLSFYAASFNGYTDFGNFEQKKGFQLYSTPVPHGYFSYTVDDFSIFSKIEIDRGLGLGLAYGMFELYYVPNQKSMLLKFEDPLNQNSKSTAFDVQSLQFSANSILDTPFSLHYTYEEESIENDKNGLSRNFTPKQMRVLQRSYTSHTFGVSYEDYIDEETRLHLKIDYEENRAKGKANSYNAYHAELDLMSSHEEFFYGDVFGYKRASYEAINPIGNKKESRNTFSNKVYVGYQYSENSAFYLSYTVLRINSNINLYDQTTSFVNLGYSYDF